LGFFRYVATKRETLKNYGLRNGVYTIPSPLPLSSRNLNLKKGGVCIKELSKFEAEKAHSSHYS